MEKLIVSVPASTANLGPGFDCMALALDLWNEFGFVLEGSGIHVEVEGEGEDRLPRDASNLVITAYLRTYQFIGQMPPRGLKVFCQNEVPLGSGLGSSATAILAGILAADRMMRSSLSDGDILGLASELEGHADNAAAAYYGGLTLVANTGEGILTRQASQGRIGGDFLQVAVAVPDVQLPTHAAREALPKSVPLSDAVFNLSMTAMVLDILKGGDLFMLDEAMNDRLHQPFRIPLIPGAREAMDAARSSGAAAAALSGAGPGVIAFGLEDMSIVAEDMVRAFEKAGIKARGYALSASEEGASTGWYDFEDAAE